MFSRLGKSKIFLKIDMSLLEIKSTKMAIDDNIIIQWKTSTQTENSAIY